MARLSLKHQYFAANLAVLWLALLCYRTNHYYLGFLSERTQALLLWMGLAYTGGGLVYYSLAREANPTHAYVALCAAWRWFKTACQHVAGLGQGVSLPTASLSKPEITSMLFLLLKLLYLPMMFEFMTSNWHALAARWWSYSGVLQMPRAEAFNEFVFPCFIDLFFSVECAFYAFGYAVESPRCRNVIKSVDTTFLGWAAALACYPPFNGLVNNWVTWYTSDEPQFTNPTFTVAARGVVLVLFAIYLYGAISLGTKCSNLTNRGIVTRGAFAYVRHPAYAAKNLAWWVAILPVISLPAVLSMAFWTLVYFLRAVTEERHLMKDPEYQAYCKTVRYRFIPGVF
jgi:protein-S-isoprenylcysteine O-methyltransferase Ste14